MSGALGSDLYRPSYRLSNREHNPTLICLVGMQRRLCWETGVTDLSQAVTTGGDQALIAQSRRYLARMHDSALPDHASSAPVVDRVPIPWNEPSSQQAPVSAHTMSCTVCNETVTVQTQRSMPPLVGAGAEYRITHWRRRNAHAVSEHGNGRNGTSVRQDRMKCQVKHTGV